MKTKVENGFVVYNVLSVNILFMVRIAHLWLLLAIVINPPRELHCVPHAHFQHITKLRIRGTALSGYSELSI